MSPYELKRSPPLALLASPHGPLDPVQKKPLPFEGLRCAKRSDFGLLTSAPDFRFQFLISDSRVASKSKTELGIWKPANRFSDTKREQASLRAQRDCFGCARPRPALRAASTRDPLLCHCARTLLEPTSSGPVLRQPFSEISVLVRRPTPVRSLHQLGSNLRMRGGRRLHPAVRSRHFAHPK